MDLWAVCLRRDCISTVTSLLGVDADDDAGEDATVTSWVAISTEGALTAGRSGVTTTGGVVTGLAWTTGNGTGLGTTLLVDEVVVDCVETQDAGWALLWLRKATTGLGSGIAVVPDPVPGTGGPTGPPAIATVSSRTSSDEGESCATEDLWGHRHRPKMYTRDSQCAV